jgi:hypothetical protein
VLRITDRATAIATGDTPAVRLIRTQLARLVPIPLRLSRLRAFGFRTLSQLRINYRGSPAVDEGPSPLRRGPRAGDRLPDAHVVEHGRDRWLQEALATPTYHLLLCGPAESWNGDHLTRLSERYAGLVAVHWLAREAAGGILHDARGEAFTRLGVEQTAHYIGYRGGATDLHGLERYLARWLPGR